MSARDRARQALTLLDLTSLGDDDTEASVSAMLERAVTPEGKVAAVCIWPRFVPLAVRRLEGSRVKVATVANFPAGAPDIDAALHETKEAVADGADEVDVVWPFEAWLAGEVGLAGDLIAACRDACGEATLKVILETGALGGPDRIAEAGRLAADAGAQFLKTSTGKRQPAATPEAAAALLDVIAERGGSIGFKASGGIRKLADAEVYMGLAEKRLGADWVTPAKFRLGASGLLDDLLVVMAA